MLSCSVMPDSATPWTLAHQDPLSMELSQQAYWSGLPFSPLWDLPHPGIKPKSLALQANSLSSEPPGKPINSNGIHTVRKHYFFSVQTGWCTTVDSWLFWNAAVNLKSCNHKFRRSEVKSFGCVWLFEIPWTVVYQVSLSMGFSRQEYWSGLPFPSPGDLPHPGIEPGSPALQAVALSSEPSEKHNFPLENSDLVFTNALSG